MNHPGIFRNLLILVPVVLTSSACVMNQPELQETRELELRVEPGSRFSIDAGAGPLSLAGDSSADAIYVTAEIHQVRPHDDYVLTLDSDGDGARLVADMNADYTGANDFIALTIRVPDSLRVAIDDGSGSMEVSGLSDALDITDGSGSMEVRDIAADVTIDDGSGSMRVANVDGDLTIEDGSGSITVHGTTGNVSIDDSSGSITVTDTGGTVTIRDGSGGITVDGAEDFDLIEDGSGSVEVTGIRSREDAQ